MGAISETDNFVCDGGQSFGAEGATTFIKCAVWPDAHGTETLSDVIANSCNDGMMQIAAKMGKDNFLKTQSTFNFGTRTGIDLPNEGKRCNPYQRDHGRDRACMFRLLDRDIH